MAAHRETGFPMTIVRPSHTYDTIVPVAVGKSDYTILDRIRRGKPVIVHGEGTSLWTLTHADDFARAFIGLLGNPRTIGHAFHITSDEWLTWDQILRLVGRAAGAASRRSFTSRARSSRKLDPDTGAGLIGDKSWNALFDNAKIKSFVPGWHAQIPFAEGIRRTVDWFDADPAAPDRRRGGRRARRRDPARLATLTRARPRRRVGDRRGRSRLTRRTRWRGWDLGFWGEGGMVYGKRRFGCNWVIKWFYAAAFAALRGRVRRRHAAG